MPEIRDLTERRPSLTVGVDASPMYDLLVTLWSLHAGDELETYELGEDWFEGIRTSMSGGLAEDLKSFTATPALWIVLMGVVHSAPEPRDIDGVLDWLDSSDGFELRKAILSLKCYDADAELLAAGAQGDEGAVEELLSAETLKKAPEWKADLERLLAIPADQLGSTVSSLLRRFRDEAFSEPEKEFGQPQDRDAASKAALIPTTSAARIIELATNGVEHRLPSHVRQLILVPSVVIRPWSLLVERDDTYVLFYPIEDEFLTTDLDSPPQAVIKTYKALGDERRLRVLRRLAESNATLQDLADYLEVAKSTAHHHIGLLRAAGLIRVRVSEDGHKEQSTYGLRLEALAETERLMHMYLHNLPAEPRSQMT